MHFGELFDEAVDVCHLGSAALSDTGAATAVDDLGLPALLGSHRTNDGFGGLDLIVAYLRILHFFWHARQHAHDPRQRTHLLELLQLV